MTFIRPIEFRGIVQRTNDISNVKQNEDNKPVHDQSNIQQNVRKNTEHLAKEVAKKDDADRNQKKFDAKEKGSNEYVRQEQKQKQKKSEDKIINKSSKGFDMKI